MRSDDRGFEGFDNPVPQPRFRGRERDSDRGPRKPKARPLQAWEQQAAALPPAIEHRFTCCGTEYGFAYAADMAVARAVHDKAKHGG